MPANRPRSPRPPITVLALIIVGLLLVPAASAEVIIDTDLVTFNDTSTSTGEYVQPAETYPAVFRELRLTDVQYRQNLAYIGFVLPGNAVDTKLDEGPNELTYQFDGGVSKPCRIHVNFQRNFIGEITATQMLIFLDDWDVGNATGTKSIVFDRPVIQKDCSRHTSGGAPTPNAYWYSLASGYQYYTSVHSILVVSWLEFRNHLTVIDSSHGYYTISLNRVIDGVPYPSRFETLLNGSTVFYNEASNDIETLQAVSLIDQIKITGGQKTFTYSLTTTENPSEGLVTVYVQNSQTGALLADSHLSILAAAGGTEVEIINATLPGGTATYTLQPTGGGSPNPDYYRAVATVPGYTQIVENHSFTLNGPHDVIIEMRPDTGGPLDPDRAYLEFYVRDIHANPVSSASVQCDGRIKTTNSQGYAVFEVSKNATYPYVAKKSGYVTIEGTATVADGPRYVANVVLGPGETPGGPGATPTPDTRTNEQKGQAVIDLIADFAEPIAILAILATIFGLMKMMTPGRR